MSTLAHSSMTNHHVATVPAAPGLLARIGAMLHTWRERREQRAELTHWSERDFRDAGLSRGDVLYEANKPFWQA